MERQPIFFLIFEKPLLGGQTNDIAETFLDLLASTGILSFFFLHGVSTLLVIMLVLNAS